MKVLGAKTLCSLFIISYTEKFLYVCVCVCVILDCAIPVGTHILHKSRNTCILMHVLYVCITHMIFSLLVCLLCIFTYLSKAKMFFHIICWIYTKIKHELTKFIFEVNFYIPNFSLTHQTNYSVQVRSVTNAFFESSALLSVVYNDD